MSIDNTEWLVNYCNGLAHSCVPNSIYANPTKEQEIRYFRTFMYPKGKHSHKRVTRKMITARSKLKSLKTNNYEKRISKNWDEG